MLEVKKSSLQKGFTTNIMIDVQIIILKAETKVKHVIKLVIRTLL